MDFAFCSTSSLNCLTFYMQVPYKVVPYKKNVQADRQNGIMISYRFHFVPVWCKRNLSQLDEPHLFPTFTVFPTAFVCRLIIQFVSLFKLICLFVCYFLFIRVLIYLPARGQTAVLAVGLYCIVLTSALSELAQFNLEFLARRFNHSATQSVQGFYLVFIDCCVFSTWKTRLFKSKLPLFALQSTPYQSHFSPIPGKPCKLDSLSV